VEKNKGGFQFRYIILLLREGKLICQSKTRLLLRPRRIAMTK
jgi:hypothetical protein